MPIHLITADAFMVSPESLQKSWKWPPWEHIQHAKENNIKDHPWFKLQEPSFPVLTTGSPPPVPKQKGKGKGKAKVVETEKDMDGAAQGKWDSYMLAFNH